MLTVGMNYHVLPGKEAEFESGCQAVLHAMEKMPGHRKTGLYRNVFEAGKYLIVSDWEQREAFDQFIQSEAFRKVADWGRKQILAGRPQHEYYEK